jgi:hypothetical protein
VFSSECRLLVLECALGGYTSERHETMFSSEYRLLVLECALGGYTSERHETVFSSENCWCFQNSERQDVAHNLMGE